MRRKKFTALFGFHASRGRKGRLGSCMTEALPTYLVTLMARGKSAMVLKLSEMSI